MISSLTEEVARTITHEGADASTLIEGGAVVVVAKDPSDDRGGAVAWKGLHDHSPGRVVEAWCESASVLVARRGAEERRFSLRQCGEFYDWLGTNRCYIDISSLSLQVWGPLVKVGMATLETLTAVYSEPSGYKRHATPTSSQFDLSVRIDGVKPLAGFARLASQVDASEALLVVFLGFEGQRALHILTQFDPVPRTVAVVGVPGYGHEHPQHAVRMNVEFLRDVRRSGDIRMASASSAFEAREVIRSVVAEYSPKHTYISPLGPKPHALGALLHCLESPKNTELLFDHPLPSQGRSTGVQRVHFYSLAP